MKKDTKEKRILIASNVKICTMINDHLSTN